MEARQESDQIEGIDNAIEFERDNSLFNNSEISRLTRPSDLESNETNDMRQQVHAFEAEGMVD